MDALTSTPGGVLAVRRTLDHPVLVTVDASGQVTSTEVLETSRRPSVSWGSDKRAMAPCWSPGPT